MKSIPITTPQHEVEFNPANIGNYAVEFFYKSGNLYRITCYDGGLVFAMTAGYKDPQDFTAAELAETNVWAINPANKVVQINPIIRREYVEKIFNLAIQPGDVLITDVKQTELIVKVTPSWLCTINSTGQKVGWRIDHPNLDLFLVQRLP